jgi:hypothetical protein
MNLESLANELFLDLFEYLSSDNLLHAFHGLNSRFDALLLDHFRTHGLDLRSISKHAFNRICRHLSLITNEITSLYLSEKDDTPGQIHEFYAYSFTLRQFIYLQSLSLYHLRSENAMNKILLDLSYLSNITHLTFEECCFTYDESNASIFVTTIWSLPKLTHCNIKIQFHPQINFPIPRVVSSTIEHLSISDIEPQFNEMTRLLENTPRLQHLSIDFHFNFSDESQSSTIITSIITLNVSFFSIEYHILVNFFQKMPNLHRLKVDLPDMYIDGKTWEQIIEIYLPKLKIFQFRMNDELDCDNNKEQQIDEILNSFRSQFWVNNHQWFVQCDWNPYSSNIFLYSLPYAFDNFYFQFPILSKSTCPDDDVLYNSVRRLTYKASLSECSSLPHRQFIKIRELCVYLPINDYFWSSVPKLERLTLLDVLSNDYNENYEIQLETLLNRASHILILRLRSWSSMVLQMLLIQKKIFSISQIDLMWCNKWYNHEECLILSRLLSDIQCKVLLIDVQNRTCILELVHTMKNLQALNVRCQDDKWNNNKSISIEGELLEWLRQNLSSLWTITRDYYPVSCIRLWIR